MLASSEELAALQSAGPPNVTQYLPALCDAGPQIMHISLPCFSDRSSSLQPAFVLQMQWFEGGNVLSKEAKQMLCAMPIFEEARSSAASITGAASTGVPTFLDLQQPRQLAPHGTHVDILPGNSFVRAHSAVQASHDTAQAGMCKCLLSVGQLAGQTAQVQIVWPERPACLTRNHGVVQARVLVEHLGVTQLTHTEVLQQHVFHRSEHGWSTNCHNITDVVCAVRRASWAFVQPQLVLDA